MCNPSKIEFIQLSSRFVKNPILSDFLIGNSGVQPSGRLCNLGVNLDRELNVSHNSGAPARAKRARSGAPWVRKFGKLSIPENLVMT